MTTLRASTSSITTRSLATGLVQVLAFTVLTALCAHARFYLPFTPVPITLQSFAVILAGAFLGSQKGFASQALLIAAGAVGLNVFSAGAGIAVILGPTGGYLLGFMLAAFVAGKMAERKTLKGFWETSALLFVASLFILIPGVIWLKVLTGSSWISAIQMGFIPFIIGDIVKTFAAAAAVKALR